MLFNSFEFIVFFPIVVILSLLIPFKHRWKLLLFSSYFFYMWWNPIYIILIFLSTVVDYYCAIKIEQQATKSLKKTYLFFSLFINLGMLCIFKYFNFFAETITYITTILDISFSLPKSNLLLPIGISFYTFQTLSYTIDVYRGKKEAEKHFGYFALFVTYFPQLVAGPIERASVLLPQLKHENNFDYDRITSGLRRMAWGFFKKMVIADRLGMIVNVVYSDPSKYNGLQLIMATVFFAYQVYCDFSGYSDIAIGASRILGVKLQENFDRPFHSKSYTELWRKWHMSIMNWFQDYLYKPLLFRNKKKLNTKNIFARTIQCILIVFAFSGMWHGAAWHYIVFGLLCGLIVIVELIVSKQMRKVERLLRLKKISNLCNGLKILYTFIIFCFCVVLFRANSVKDGVLIYKSIIKYFYNFSFDMTSIKESIRVIVQKFDFVVIIISLLVLELVQIMQYKYDLYRDILKKQNAVIRFGIYLIFLGSILFFSVYEELEFIYFQF